ncbi:MAG: formyltransferase family protein [bacterium]|nr:formyltransferase family protein [bacterium]
MKQTQVVGLLTSRNHPLLPYFLDGLNLLSEVEPVLIFDEKDFSEKDIRIFFDRTQGVFPSRDLKPFLDRYRWTTVPNHNGRACCSFVRENGIGLLVNAGTPRIIKPDLLEAASIGVLNAHPGILPQYRGASCCEWAIYNNDPVGVTAHFMDAGIDSGPILFSRELLVTKGQSYTDVRIGLYCLAHEVRIEAIQMIFERGLTPDHLSPQPEASAFKPIPDQYLEVVKARLVENTYQHAC